MHVLVIEIVLTGHHVGYLTHCARTYLDNGHDVTIAIAPWHASDASLASLEREYGARITVVHFDESACRGALSHNSDLRREFALWLLFFQMHRTRTRVKRVDYVFLPYLDYCLYAIGLLGSPFAAVRWGGICMRPSFHYQSRGVLAPRPRYRTVKRLLFLRLLRIRTLHALLSIDLPLIEDMKQSRATLGALKYLADPAELVGTHTMGSARSALGIPDEARVVLVYGVVDRRKGLEQVLSGLCSTSIIGDFHLLVVGALSGWARDLLAGTDANYLRASGRLHVVDRFVSDSEQQMVFAACDVVWLGYREHYTMSGVLVLAATAGKCVVATELGLIGWYARRAGLGPTISGESTEDVAYALNAAVAMRISNDCARIFATHTWDNFSRLLIEESPL
jgi:glycosyltransferase involved in cell wall biosynthesis